MLGFFSNFAAASGPVTHIAPGSLFKLAGFPITNSMIYGWGVLLVIIAFLIWTAHRVTVKPKGGFVQFVEYGVEFIRNLVETSFEDKRRAGKYVAYFVTLFFLLVFNNLSELTPLIGSAFHYHSTNLLRPWTADLNATFAMGSSTMLIIYAASIKESGSLRKYMRHFFVGNPKNPIYFVSGLLEMLSDAFRVISLSLRLFLNISIGSIIIIVFAYLGHTILAPITATPFTLIELFVDFLQAYIFVILSVMYLTIVVNHVTEEDRQSENLTESAASETMTVSTNQA
ncbi:MAG: F0F1 ATP synthase subunit A [Candidatus Saccharimonadales bacterium]